MHRVKRICLNCQLKEIQNTDYSRSERHVRDATSRIDKDLKAELRETAFQMWMACYSQQEIANEVGYTKQAVGEFLDLLQLSKNVTGSENGQLSEKPKLAVTADREYDDEDDDDSNSLGVYQLDKRLLIKANHLDEYFKPPIYNIWKQQDKSNAVSHFGNSEITWVDNLLYLYTKPFDVGLFMLVVIGIELLETIMKTYITQGQPHYEVVLSVAIIAISRKVIILDLKEVDSLILIGIASIVVALTVGYFLMKRSQSQDKIRADY